MRMQVSWRSLRVTMQTVGVAESGTLAAISIVCSRSLSDTTSDCVMARSETLGAGGYVFGFDVLCANLATDRAVSQKILLGQMVTPATTWLRIASSRSASYRSVSKTKDRTFLF